MEGLQVKQINEKGFDFLISPLDTSALYDPQTMGFRNTPENMELIARINELARALKDSNVQVGSLTNLTNQTKHDKVAA